MKAQILSAFAMSLIGVSVNSLTNMHKSLSAICSLGLSTLAIIHAQAAFSQVPQLRTVSVESITQGEGKISVSPSSVFLSFQFGGQPTEKKVAVTGTMPAQESQHIIDFEAGDRFNSKFWSQKVVDNLKPKADSTLTLPQPPYVPVSGDYNGDGYDDIFWYGPGSVLDSIWLGRSDGDFNKTNKPIVNGIGYIPVSGDYNGDGYDDIFWYGPGGILDSIWFGRPDGDFDKTNDPVVRGTGYIPVSGDYNGDGYDDIFWYGPGGILDSIWFGRPDGDFDKTNDPVVNG